MVVLTLTLFSFQIWKDICEHAIDDSRPKVSTEKLSKRKQQPQQGMKRESVANKLTLRILPRSGHAAMVDLLQQLWSSK